MFKKIFTAVGNGISKTWSFLEGSKRRVAVVSGFVMTVTKPYTLAYKIAEGALYLFGGADAASATTKAIKKNLPSGKR